jgi:flagellar hook protein FlgE
VYKLQEDFTMLSSMFTAISALKMHQQYLDVISNNLANANTTGYKANRFLFQDQYYQMIGSGSAPTATQGGTNPLQIGLGVQAGYVSPTFIQGSLQSTGRNLDLAIQGDGFFIYNSGVSQHYSREGSLTLDANSNLVNAASGLRVQGWMKDAGGKIDTTLSTIDITIPAGSTKAQATTKVSLTGNLNADLAAMPLGAGKYTVTLGAYDSLGNPVSVPTTFTRDATDPLTWAWAGGGGSGKLTFDSTGHLAPNTTGTMTITGVGGAATTANGTTVDFSSMTMVNDANSATVASQNGLPAGTMTDVAVSPNDGMVTVVYSNGLTEQVGQVAIARFTNPEGLIATGHTMFQAGVNSGTPQVGTANSGGRGVIAAGYLEGSNVDMAQEFTNMILAQRGFQASAKVITTSDEVIQDLVNLKR